MLFGIEADLGQRISGYCVPDSFSASSLLSVSAAGHDCLVIHANERRDALVVAGRHETGLCGFTLDESNFPDLAAADDLEIRDVTTDMPIYRRRAAFAVQAGAFFRLETQLRPLRAVDAAFERRIAASYTGLELLNLETVTQIFCLDRNAIYVSGRLNYRSIEAHLADGFRLAAVVQDPYVELAERLIVLRSNASALAERLGAREAAAFAPAAAFARALDGSGAAGLKHAFKHVSHDVAFALGNPLLRQLASHPSSGALDSRSLSAALNLLAQFDVVGLHDGSAVCADAFGDWLGHDVEESAFAPPNPEVRHLSARLRETPHCGDLIAADLELYGHVAAACRVAEEWHAPGRRVS